MKLCTKCLKIRELAYFNLCSAKKDGLAPHCKNCVKAYNTSYYQINSECIKQATNAYHWANRSKCNLRSKEWTKNNLARHNEHSAKRRAAERQGGMLAKIYREHIVLFYEAAKALTGEMGIKMVVDHIIPLRGKTVSGLHVPWNLQVITATENSKKYNKVAA